MMERFWSKVETKGPDDCWPFTKAKDRQGYGRFLFEGKNRHAHRIAFLLAYGTWPMPKARHTCDNPPCCNPRHIVAGTQQDNIADMDARGRRRTNPLRGTKHHNARLSDETIAAIREAQGTMREIGERFGICPQYAWQVRTFQRRKEGAL